MNRHPTDFVAGHRSSLILGLCCLAQFLGVLDVTVVNVALPPIQAELGFSTGRLAARVGSGRVLAFGLTLLGACLLLFARGGAGELLAPSLLCAAGIGCSFVSATITATTGVRREDSGVASGLVNTSFQVGGSVGLAVVATIAAGGGFQVAFASGSVIALAGAAVALRPSWPVHELGAPRAAPAGRRRHRGRARGADRRRRRARLSQRGGRCHGQTRFALPQRRQRAPWAPRM